MVTEAAFSGRETVILEFESFADNRVGQVDRNLGLATPRPSIVFSRRMVVGRPADGRRTVVDGARVVNGAEKKAFDRGGPIWPPRSNAADDRLGGAGLGNSAPQPKLEVK